MAFFYTTSPLGFYDDTEYPPPAGAVPMTDSLHAALFAGQAAGRPIVLGSDDVPTLGPAPTPVPLIIQQAEAMLAAGLSITSTSTAAINATYSADPVTIGNIQSEVISILLNGHFADGGDTLVWPDINGNAKTFPDEAVFKAFATAIASFVASIAKVQIGASQTLPAANVTIA